MKCQVCGKHEATVLYTHISEDEKKVLYLCAECVAARQMTKREKPVPAVEPKAEVKVAVQLTQAQDGQEVEPKCSHCGLTYDEFRKHGRFGCHLCYESFSGQLGRLLRRIHGADQHRGKGLVPRHRHQAMEAGLRELQQALSAAVASEAYEQAARLRDQIQASENSARGQSHETEEPEDAPG